MAIEIRAVLPVEQPEFQSVLSVSAGRPVLAADAAVPGPEVVNLAVFDDGVIVGGTGAESVELTVPGPSVVRAAKITLTGLLPTHRGRDLAGELMRAQLADLRIRGYPVAILTAAESNVPGWHGYAVATQSCAVEIPTSRTATSGRLALLDVAAARPLLPDLYDRYRRARTGGVSRSPDFWAAWWDDVPVLRITPAERQFVVAYDPDGGLAGYLTYRLEFGPLREQPVRALAVEDLIAVTDDAHRALWRFCLGFRPARSVTAWNVPPDDPAVWLLPDPRDMRIEAVRPFLRLRLVDVPAALGARRYAVDDTLVVEVADPFLDANNGRYRLSSADGRTSCEGTDDPADLALTVVELAAMYLGGTDPRTLHRAGRIDERTSDAVDRVARMFATPRVPWTVTDW